MGHEVPAGVSPVPDRADDVYSRLLSERIVFLGAPIDGELANLVCAQLLHLAAAEPETDIRMFVNSPGGTLEGMLSIYDTMEVVGPNVTTTCMGQAASVAAVLLAAGAPGKRYALPHSRVLIHQPRSSLDEGGAGDIATRAREIVRRRELADEVLARHTGQPVERIRHDTQRDLVMSASEALEYGIVDRVVEARDVAGPTSLA